MRSEKSPGGSSRSLTKKQGDFLRKGRNYPSLKGWIHSSQSRYITEENRRVERVSLYCHEHLSLIRVSRRQETEPTKRVRRSFKLHRLSLKTLLQSPLPWDAPLRTRCLLWSKSRSRERIMRLEMKYRRICIRSLDSLQTIKIPINRTCWRCQVKKRLCLRLSCWRLRSSTRHRPSSIKSQTSLLLRRESYRGSAFAVSPKFPTKDSIAGPLKWA